MIRRIAIVGLVAFTLLLAGRADAHRLARGTRSCCSESAGIPANSSFPAYRSASPAAKSAANSRTSTS